MEDNPEPTTVTGQGQKCAGGTVRRCLDTRLVLGLLKDITRSQFLKGLSGLDDPEQFRTAWPHTTCLSIVRRIDSFIDDPMHQQHLTGVLRTHLEGSGIREHSDEVIGQIPLCASVVGRADRRIASVRSGEQVDGLRMHAHFIEPSNGQLGLELGELTLRNGWPSKAVAIWKQALRADESLRYPILVVYSMTGHLESQLKQFRPSTYVQAIKALMQSKRSKLTEGLRQDAAGLWTEPKAQPTAEYQRLHSDYLQYLGDLQGRIEWLEQCVSWQPNTVWSHQDLAVAYSAEKRWSDSEDQWNDVLRFDAGNRFAKKEIAEIRKKRKQDEK